MNRLWEIMCLMSSKVSSTLRFYSSKYNLNTSKFLSSKKASLPESVTFITSNLNTTKSYRECKYLELGVQVESHENLVKNEIPKSQVKTHHETIHTKIHAKQNKKMLIASLLPIRTFQGQSWRKEIVGCVFTLPCPSVALRKPPASPPYSEVNIYLTHINFT